MDKIDPKKKVQIRKVQKWQKENVPITAIAKGFKKYKNYYVPEKLVKNSNRVLSFGVGADVKFEKLLCKDNHDLQVKLFDPTPLTTKYIKNFIIVRTLDSTVKMMVRGEVNLTFYQTLFMT